MSPTDCNSMRRDMTSSLRACLAAESWKRLWPDGKPTGRPGKNGSKNILVYEDFAQSSFKVSPAYAKQALSILNHSPELLEDAKNGLAHLSFEHLSLEWRTCRHRPAPHTLEKAKIVLKTCASERMKYQATCSAKLVKLSTSGKPTADPVNVGSHHHLQPVDGTGNGRNLSRNHWQSYCSKLPSAQRFTMAESKLQSWIARVGKIKCWTVNLSIRFRLASSHQVQDASGDGRRASLRPVL